MTKDAELMRFADGREVLVHAAVAGAEGRYEDWIYLQMIEREWKRPLNDAERLSALSAEDSPSSRAAIVLVFWSYFETRLERLLRAGMRSLPASVMEDLLRRYSTVGARLDRLFRTVFGASYFEDLRMLGYTSVEACLREVQQRRNEFAHGNPRALDDAFVSKVVAMLRLEHESWIAVFNLRTALPHVGRSGKPGSKTALPDLSEILCARRGFTRVIR